MDNDNFFTEEYFREIYAVFYRTNMWAIEKLAQQIYNIKRQKGRLFIVGNGGSLATASHAVNDFRKIVGIEAYNPGDNCAELTARTNDDGFDTVFSEWLKTSQLNDNDAILVLSVGGGNKELGVSLNIVKAIDYAMQVGCTVLGIVGKDGGYTAENADSCVIIPTVNNDRITPHVESWHSIILHLLVSHPLLKENQTKWESMN